MRINKFVASASGLSRRAADQAIVNDRVKINHKAAVLGDNVTDSDEVELDNELLHLDTARLTIMLNKPVGYVCSRNGQGSQTIYDLLPGDYRALKPVGRLDKDSSGLILLTNNGELAQQLSHPSYAKIKVYKIELDKPLQPLHQQMINDYGVQLDDGLSRLSLAKLTDGLNWQVTMNEGRNRQIRRTFASLGYEVKRLHRTSFGGYALGELASAKFKEIE
jgi:23S rRNA pseudouridine2605 synthase